MVKKLWVRFKSLKNTYKVIRLYDIFMQIKFKVLNKYIKIDIKIQFWLI
jgi:hypothetical protein